MTGNQQTVLQTVTDFRMSFEKAAKHYYDEVNKENEKFFKAGRLKALFMVLSTPLSEATMGIANVYQSAAYDLKEIETILQQSVPDKTAALSKLEALKIEFAREAGHPGEMHPVNLVKRAKRSAEFKAYSKKADEIIRMI